MIKIFEVIIALDESQVFDCPCCAGRSDEDQKAEMEKLDGEIEHHICMILQGDAWRVKEDYDPLRGFYDLTLKALGDRTFKRVGAMRINSTDREAARM